MVFPSGSQMRQGSASEKAAKPVAIDLACFSFLHCPRDGLTVKLVHACACFFAASWRRPKVFSRFSGALKPSWYRLGGVLEALGGALEAFWRRLGGVLEALGGVLEAPWRF